MKTLRLTVNPKTMDSESSQAALRQAAEILRAGGTVAFATETVYGLGANALDPAALQRIFAAKRRPSWDPLIVHMARLEQVEQVAVNVSQKARLLMDAFWPGPLTLLLPKSDALPPAVTAGLTKIAVRQPSHPVARRLIDLAGLPIAAPSANAFGRTSPTRAEFVLEDLDGRIDAVIDSGETTLGLESTVLDVCEDPPVLCRPGMIPLDSLQEVCGRVVARAGTEAVSPSPGGGLKHYAPRARLVLLETAKSADNAVQLVREFQARGDSVGIMATDLLPVSRMPPGALVYRWGKSGNYEELSKRLFAGLRELDRAGATVIFCPLPDEQGIGAAIRDRLIRAR